jgi:hypothetical protein
MNDGRRKMKLCKDCKYYRKEWWEHLVYKTDYWDTCMRPNDNNPVSGIPNYYRCGYERMYEYLCGPEGTYWEAK